MPTTVAIEVTNAMTQSNLNGEMLNHKIELKVATTGKKRGPQKARTKVADNMIIASMVDEDVLFKQETYLKLSSGNLLPEAWKYLYGWFGSAINSARGLETVNG